MIMAGEANKGRPPPLALYMDLSRAYGNVKHTILLGFSPLAGRLGRCGDAAALLFDDSNPTRNSVATWELVLFPRI